METPRIILFKAKREDNNEWIEGSYVHQKDNYGTSVDWHYILEGTWTLDYDIDEPIRVDPTTLSQFTGLYDQNGKRIWENDIIRCKYNDYGEKGSYIGKVIFRKDICAFVVTNTRSTDYEWWNEEKEIIGNLFDNPELIEGELKDE